MLVIEVKAVRLRYGLLLLFNKLKTIDMKIGLYLNGTLIWKCSSWSEFEEVEKEQREYHKGENVVITHKYL